MRERLVLEHIQAQNHIQGCWLDWQREPLNVPLDEEVKVSPGDLCRTEVELNACHPTAPPRRLEEGEGRARATAHFEYSIDIRRE